jgi:hypothetical protein
MRKQRLVAQETEQAGAIEVVVSPEMIEAGFAVVSSRALAVPFDEAREFVEDVFLAMMLARKPPTF